MRKILVFLFLLLQLPALADMYQCNDSVTATKALELLQSEETVLLFCSNCAAKNSALIEVKIIEVKIVEDGCDHELVLVAEEGGILPAPVFGGECSPDRVFRLQRNMRRLASRRLIREKIDLAYVYVKRGGSYITVAEAIGLLREGICLPELVL